MTLTKSLRTCRRFLTSLLVMTAVVRYRSMCGHMVWMAFRYLNNNTNDHWKWSQKKKYRKKINEVVIILQILGSLYPHKKSNSLRLIKKEFNDVVSAFGMVEEHKEGPVYEPGPLLQGLERGAHRLKGKSMGTSQHMQHQINSEKHSDDHSGFSWWQRDKASCGLFRNKLVNSRGKK